MPEYHFAAWMLNLIQFDAFPTHEPNIIPLMQNPSPPQAAPAINMSKVKCPKNNCAMQ